MKHRQGSFRLRGFTLIELMVVVAVLAILAGVSVVGYGKWRESVAQKEVQSDLQMAAAAMLNARNFGNGGFPGSLPSSIKSSPNVALSGGGYDEGAAYCVQGTSVQVPAVTWFISNTSTRPQAGNCSGLSGLVGWWPMNGNANDVSGNNNHGTVSNATTATGQGGAANTAYSFNGTNAYIDAGNSTSLAFTNNFTLSAWIRPTGYHTTGYYGLMNGILARGPAATYNYALQATNSTTVSFIKRTGSEGIQFYNFTGVPSLTNVWTLVTITVKDGTATLYRNGTVQGAASVGAIAGVANDRLYLGSEAGGGSTELFFIGSIDDVRIYNRSLPAGDVEALYAAGAQ